MRAAITALQWTTAIGFAILGIIATARWVRRRDRHHGMLALAVGSLGLISVAGRLSPLLDYPRLLSDFSIVGFVASGYGLLLFRATVAPLGARARRLPLAVLTVAGIATAAARLPNRPQATFTLGPVEFLVVLSLIAAWSWCVGEPAIHFWRAARGRAHVQRMRLRALSLGYLGIVVVLVFAVVAAPAGYHAGLQLGVQAMVLGLVPLLYAALAPPRMLRRAWRAREQTALRHAIEQIMRAPDRETLGRDSLAWALRLLGAEAGAIGRPELVLATHGLAPSDAAALVGAVRRAGIERDASGWVVGCPVEGGEERIALAVRSAPFTPVFGTDELGTIVDLARSVGIAMERLRLLEAVRYESERNQVMLRAVGDLGVGFVIAAEDGIAYANPALVAMTGYTEEELLALPMTKLLPVRERGPALERMRRRLEGETTDSFWESPLLTKDGRVRHLEGASQSLTMNGRPHVLTIARDVTERHLASERERKRSQQLDALARVSQGLAGNLDVTSLAPGIARAAGAVAACSGAWVALHAPGGRVEWFDREGASEAAHAAPTIEMVTADGRPMHLAGGSIGGSNPASDILLVPMVRSGRSVGALVLSERNDGAPFDDLDESIALSLASYAAEAIEAARAYERERTMAERLRELDQMKNSFLAAVSHELRTPLTAVLGFAQTLQRSLGALTPAERAEIIDRLAANAGKLQALLADLLDLDRLQRGIFEPVKRSTDIGSLIDRVVAGFELPEGRTLTTDVSSYQIDVDAPKIERIVENLLSNGVRHTPPDAPIWVRAFPHDAGYLIAVEDAGGGVPKDLRTDVFEPFRRGPGVAPYSPGVGIGLSLVTRFAELHGGRAWVEERIGGGASFRVWLPTSDAPDAAEAGVAVGSPRPAQVPHRLPLRAWTPGSGSRSTLQT